MTILQFPGTRNLPSYPDIERAVLGAILHNPSIPNAALKAAIEIEHLHSLAFTIPAHIKIFQRMVKIHWGGKLPINLETLTEAFLAKLVEESPEFFRGLYTEVEFARKVLEYARIIREASQARGLVAVDVNEFLLMKFPKRSHRSV
jgi:replicative DNA helicase